MGILTLPPDGRVASLPRRSEAILRSLDHPRRQSVALHLRHGRPPGAALGDVARAVGLLGQEHVRPPAPFELLLRHGGFSRHAPVVRAVQDHRLLATRALTRPQAEIRNDGLTHTLPAGTCLATTGPLARPPPAAGRAAVRGAHGAAAGRRGQGGHVLPAGHRLAPQLRATCPSGRPRPLDHTCRRCRRAPTRPVAAPASE